MESSIPPVTTVAFTMMIWIKPANTTSRGLVGVENSASNANHFRMALGGTGGVQAVCNGTATGSSPASSNSVWQCIIGQFISATSRQAFNGATASSVNTTNLTPSGVNILEIGAFNNGGSRSNFFPGILAEIAFWSLGSLTADDRLALRSGLSALAVRPQNLISYIPLVDTPIDLIANRSISVTAATQSSDHPAIFYP